MNNASNAIVLVSDASRKPINGKRETDADPRSDPKYLSEVDQLRGLLADFESKPWVIGDMVNQLRAWQTDNYGKALSFSQLAADLDLPRVKGNYLNRLSLNAQMFPEEMRALKPDWTWFDFDKLRRAQKRLPNGKTPVAKNRRADGDELQRILGSKKVKSVRDFSNRLARLRQMRRQRETKEERTARREAFEQNGAALPFNRSFHQRWEEVVPSLPDGSIDGMIADPPFPRIGNYYATRNTAADLSRAVGNECDNADEDSAIATTLALFDHSKKFTQGGFILLFSEGGYPLDAEVLTHAKAQGWYVYRELHLIKVDDEAGVASLGQERQVSSPAPSLMDEPFGPVEIKLTLFFREGYSPNRVGTYSNQNVYFFRSTSRRAAAEVRSGQAEPGYRHHFECPPDAVEQVMVRLLHRRTGQLVVEPFGCTGPATVAAVRNGWDWIYCESNARNYERGLQRIEAALNAQKKSILFPTAKAKASGAGEGQAAPVAAFGRSGTRLPPRNESQQIVLGGSESAEWSPQLTTLDVSGCSL